MFHSMNRKIIAMLLTWMLFLQMIVGNGAVSVRADEASSSVRNCICNRVDTYGATESQRAQVTRNTLARVSAFADYDGTG